MTGFRILTGMAAMAMAAAVSGQTVNISGVVTDSAGAPVAGVEVKLEKSGQTATSGADGKFVLGGGTGIATSLPGAARAEIHEGRLFLSVPARGPVTVTAFGPEGKALAQVRRELDAGSHGIALPEAGAGVRFYRVETGSFSTVVHGLSVEGAIAGAGIGATAARAAAKSSAAALYDVITGTKTGYLKSYLSISNSEMTGVTIKMLKTTTPKFSFFVTSMRGLVELAKNDKGFGGDLRFGETGPGAGLRGADKICATLAEKSMPASSFKGWRAFLSVASDANGAKVDAISRVGAGPWYDRVGRMLAPSVNDLKGNRPQNGDAEIQWDLPNEYGVKNHRPDPSAPQEDNHHMMTGSTSAGLLKTGTTSATCKDWTVADGAAANGKPSCGFAWPRGGVGSTGSGSNWLSTWDAPGCAAGIDVFGSGGPVQGDVSVGGGGGYGGFYCFALNP